MNAELKRFTTDELWAEFHRLLGDLAANLRRLALIYCELIDRGEDVSGFKGPLTRRLPAIAAGRLLPDMVIRYPGQTELLSAAETIVREDQQKLVAENAAVPLVVWQGRGRVTVSRKPETLTPAEVYQVLGDGRIRTPEEQVHHMPQPPRSGRSRPVDIEPALGMLFDLLDLEPTQRNDIEAKALATGRDVFESVRQLLIADGWMRDRRRSAR